MKSAVTGDVSPPRQTPAASEGKRKRKRKKSRSTLSKEDFKYPMPKTQDCDESKPVGKKRKLKQDEPLKGMIVAVSTLDVKGESCTDSASSYKVIVDLCQSLGASVSGQLHRRVSCLVCNQTAVNNSTQRVRKAVKKKVPLVDIEWIRQCRQQNKCVDLEAYRLDNVAHKVIESRAVKASDVRVPDTVPNEDELPSSSWSEPKSLGCCCVCHENGDSNCPWCVECNVKS